MMDREALIADILEAVPPGRDVRERAISNLNSLPDERLRELVAQVRSAVVTAKELRSEPGVSVEASAEARMRAISALRSLRSKYGTPEPERPVSAIAPTHSALATASVPTTPMVERLPGAHQKPNMTQGFEPLRESFASLLIQHIVASDNASGLNDQYAIELRNFLEDSVATSAIQQFLSLRIDEIVSTVIGLILSQRARNSYPSLDIISSLYNIPRSVIESSIGQKSYSLHPEVISEHFSKLPIGRSIESLAILGSKFSDSSSRAILCLDNGGELVSHIIASENTISESKIFVVDRSDPSHWFVRGINETGGSDERRLDVLREARSIVVIDDIARSGASIQRAIEMAHRLNSDAKVSGAALVCSPDAHSRLAGEDFYSPNLSFNIGIGLPWNNKSGNNFLRSEESYVLGHGTNKLAIPTELVHRSQLEIMNFNAVASRTG